MATAANREKKEQKSRRKRTRKEEKEAKGDPQDCIAHSDTNCCDMVTANEVQRKMGEEGEGTEGDREGGGLGKDANYID